MQGGRLGARVGLAPIPLASTTFINRGRELAALEDLLPTHPILTITGPAGCGKTRLAVEFAKRHAHKFAGYVVWVDLTAVSSPALMPQTIASALGIRERSGQPLMETLAEHLRDRPCLLVVDDCDHHAKAVGSLAATLTRAAPDLRILATSRELLGARDERVVPLSPLEVPPAANPYTSGGLAAATPSLPASQQGDPVAAPLTYDAVALFVERAQRACPDFELTPTVAPPVCSIVRRLNGLPLALELAAARLRGLSVQQLDACLDDGLSLLTCSDSSAPSHHQTLAAAIEWSYQALSPAEQALFRSLSLFAGGFTLDAAHAMHAASSGATSARMGSTAALLCQLADKSWLMLDRQAGRYTILGLLADYGREQLAVDSAALPVRLYHARYYLALAERLMSGGDAGAADHLAVLAMERDNLRLAMETFAAARDGEAALRLACSLQSFWETRGSVSEGRRYLGTALAVGQPSPPSIRARALEASGALAHVASDYPVAAQELQEALTLWEAAQDEAGVARCQLALALLAKDQGQYPEAMLRYSQSLALFERLGDRRQTANVLTNMGILAHLQGDYRLSTRRFEASVALYRQLDDRRGIAYALSNLGLAARNQGHYDRAQELHDEALALRRAAGDELGVAYSLANLGLLAQNQGQLDDAQARQAASLAAFKRLGHQAGVALLLSTLAQTALYQDDVPRAHTLGAESLALYQSLGNTWGIATALHILATVTFEQGDEATARAQVTDSLTLRRDLDDRHGIAECLEALAVIEGRHMPARARTLLVLASEVRPLIPAPRAPIETLYLRARLGELPSQDAHARRLLRCCQDPAAAFQAAVDFALPTRPSVVVDIRPEICSQQALRQAMRHLNDIAYLQRSPLVETVAAMTGARPTGRAVRLLLLEAIETLRPTQRGDREDRRALAYHLLRRRFVDEDSLQDVARALGLSERQYYREQQAALDLLQEALHERRAQARAS